MAGSQSLYENKASPFSPRLGTARQKQNTSNNSFQSFCVKINFLEGLKLPILKENESCHLQAILFDQAYYEFIGNKWHGPTLFVRSDRMSINQTLYFYTPISSVDLLLAIEIVIKSRNGNVCKVFGWAVIPLSEIQEQNAHSVSSKAPLYYGSPIALLYMNWIQERSTLFKNGIGVELAYTISSHPLLMRVEHLVPENMLVSNEDYIPGLLPCSKDKLNDPDCLLKPQLQKCVTFILEQITIKVQPVLQTVESEIISKMLEEKSLLGSPSHKYDEASITQRRLQVGVHNGLCYIQEPDLYHLLVQPVITPMSDRVAYGHQRSSSVGSLSFFREECLALRSDVKIPNVPNDPNIMLVFIIEYGISFKNSVPDHLHLTSSFTKSPTSSVPVFWGFCRLSEFQEKSAVSISLTNHPYSCPSHILFLKTSPFHKFDLLFSITMHQLKKKEDASTSSVCHSREERVQQFVSIPSENMTSTPIHSHLSNSSESHTYSQKKLPCFSTPFNDTMEYADVKQRASENSYHFPKASGDEEKNEPLHEIAVVPSSLTFVPPAIHSFSGERKPPHSFFSKVYATGFTPILDRNGCSPFIIDSSLPYVVDITKELSNPPQGSEITFQFLAISGLLPLKMTVPNVVLFKYKFYRFPSMESERLYMEPVNISEETSCSLHILQVCSPDERSGFPAGYQVSYSINPSDFNSCEYRPFIYYLESQNIDIDLWDGDSMLYLGTTYVPLKYLCRQERDAVSVTLELSIMHNEYLDDSQSHFGSVASAIIGHLHLRLTNVKVPLSPKSLSKLEGMKEGDSVIVSPRKEVSKNYQKAAPVVTKAKPVAEITKNLTSLMATRSFHDLKDHMLGSSITAERRRKLTRMEAVRSLTKENHNQSVYPLAKDLRNLIKERQKDLLIVEEYMKSKKSEMIHSMLQTSITTEQTIHPSLGTISYFEFELLNPFPFDQTISISWTCAELRLVTDAKEWQFLQELHHMKEKVGRCLFSQDVEDLPCVFLQPHEKVYVPFKYQCTQKENEPDEAWKTVSGHHFTTALLNAVPSSGYLNPHSIKIVFLTSEKSLTDVLLLNIQPLPPLVTNVFKFLSPEHSIFKKTIRLKKREPFCQDIYILCTDFEVVHEIQNLPKVTDYVDISIKVPIGSIGTSRTFLLFIFESPFSVKPMQTLKVSVSPVQRIDLSCTSGQLIKSSIIIRGDHATRLVKCFSDSQELVLDPCDAFLLPSCSVEELAVSVRPLLPGMRYFCISMVNQELHQSLRTWLVVLTSQKPAVSKAFQVQLSLGKETTKRITFTNHFSELGHYLVYCSHPHLLRLKDLQFSVPGKHSFSLGLYFPMQRQYLSENVFLYINRTEGRNEEIYCIKVTCK